MTGNRALSCVFCRILRLIEINRRISSVKYLRVPAGVSCINTRRTFSTSPWLQDRSKDSKPGTGSSSSESSSDGSESDSDRESAENSKEAEKAEAKPDLLTLLSKMKASENKWGPKENVELNLKEIEHSIDSKLVSEAVKLSKELPGDKEKSESDLVGRLLALFETTAKQRKGAVPIETPTKAKGLSIDSKLVSEAVKLSKELPGDKEKSESDLVGRLLAQFDTTAKQRKGAVPIETPTKAKGLSIDSKLVSEAVKLSKELPGDKEKSESDLVDRLLAQFDTTAKQRKGAVPIETPTKAKGLSALMEGLTVEKEIRKHSDKGEGRYKIYEYEEGHKKPLMFRQRGSGLFEGKPLGIFTPEDMKSEHNEKKSLFEVVEEEDKNLLQFFPPQNAFEEQIQWTKEGKLWTFPIDNEAGWEEELNVEFYEHVFLENQLHDFPKKGPIRHFMELVTTALSKNPYLTVAQKHEHIDWYKNYFHGKQDMLEARLGRDGVIQAEA